METSRKIAAGIIGLVIIIALFFVAKWTGDQIRERFLKPKAPAMVITAKAPVTKNDNLLGEKTAKTATYSAIPSTGPNDWVYLAFVVLFASGIVTLKLANSTLDKI